MISNQQPQSSTPTPPLYANLAHPSAFRPPSPTSAFEALRSFKSSTQLASLQQHLLALANFKKFLLTNTTATILP